MNEFLNLPEPPKNRTEESFFYADDEETDREKGVNMFILKSLWPIIKEWVVLFNWIVLIVIFIFLIGIFLLRS